LTELEKLERDYAIVKARGARPRLLEMMEEEIAALSKRGDAGIPPREEEIVMIPPEEEVPL